MWINQSSSIRNISLLQSVSALRYYCRCPLCSIGYLASPLSSLLAEVPRGDKKNDRPLLEGKSLNVSPQSISTNVFFKSTLSLLWHTDFRNSHYLFIFKLIFLISVSVCKTYTAFLQNLYPNTPVKWKITFCLRRHTSMPWNCPVCLASSPS